MIGMLLNVVHIQVQKRQQKHITKELNGFHKVNLLAEAELFVSQVNGTPLFVRQCLKRWLAQGSSWTREPSTRDNFSPYNKCISQLNQQTVYQSSLSTSIAGGRVQIPRSRVRRPLLLPCSTPVSYTLLTSWGFEMWAKNQVSDLWNMKIDIDWSHGRMADFEQSINCATSVYNCLIPLEA